MEHLKDYKNFQINENILFLAIGMAAPLLLIYGALWGYIKVNALFNYGSFKHAKKKLDFIMSNENVINDPELRQLLQLLYEYRDGLYYGEEEGENQRRTRAFEIKRQIYQRLEQLLSAEEYKKFVKFAKTFELGSEKPAGYFKDKDAKFQGFKYTV